MCFSTPQSHEKVKIFSSQNKLTFLIKWPEATLGAPVAIVQLQSFVRTDLFSTAQTNEKVQIFSSENKLTFLIKWPEATLEVPVAIVQLQSFARTDHF